ncbi:MAG: hypothetical protein ABI318_00270, partial [Chthoniobacteraceae bacterium]
LFKQKDRGCPRHHAAPGLNFQAASFPSKLMRLVLGEQTGCRHMSNVGLADRNYGLNSFIAQAGVSWLS